MLNKHFHEHIVKVLSFWPLKFRPYCYVLFSPFAAKHLRKCLDFVVGWPLKAAFRNTCLLRHVSNSVYFNRIQPKLRKWSFIFLQKNKLAFMYVSIFSAWTLFLILTLLLFAFNTNDGAESHDPCQSTWPLQSHKLVKVEGQVASLFRLNSEYIVQQ